MISYRFSFDFSAMLLTCFVFPLALLTSTQFHLLPFRSIDACDVLFCVLSQWFLIVFVMLLFLGFPYEGGGWSTCTVPFATAGISPDSIIKPNYISALRGTCEGTKTKLIFRREAAEKNIAFLSNCIYVGAIEIPPLRNIWAAMQGQCIYFLSGGPEPPCRGRLGPQTVN